METPASPTPAELLGLPNARLLLDSDRSDLDGATFRAMLNGLFVATAGSDSGSRDMAGKSDRERESTVRNPTAGCNADGGFGGDSRRDSDNHSETSDVSSRIHAASSSGERRQKRDGKSRDNAVVGVAPQPPANPEDQRVYASYEEAGLPKGELARLVRVLHDSAVAKQHRVTVSLKLRELGEIKFDVRFLGNKVIINAHVGNSRAAAAMALAISDLRTRLEECGLVLERFDVTTGDSDEAKRRKGRGGAGGGSAKQTSHRGTKSPKNVKRNIEEDGRLHVLA
ncbi:MAG: flagellar hook-length control protein FliK [Deltaproteobacteria bacterium]|nr:flagellar hook-length control protein FliK [Deltaproteobacteria bacterium]